MSVRNRVILNISLNLSELVSSSDDENILNSEVLSNDKR